MKIIFANNYYYLRGGSERVFFDEMSALSQTGYQVIPFSMNHLNNNVSEWSDFFAPTIEYENVSLTKKLANGPKLVYSYQSRSYFNRLVKKVQPDILHAHNIYGRLTTSIIDTCKKSYIPVVMTLHDYKLICPSYLLLNGGGICDKCKQFKYYHCFWSKCHKNNRSASLVYTVESYFNYLLEKYNKVDFFICPSKFIFRKHEEGGILPEKLIYLPNYVNIDSYVPDFLHKNYILFVGRLSKEKGLFTLLKAVKGVDVQLRIVGDGAMRAELELFAQENDINNVQFDGYKSGVALKEIFRGAMFVVFPSEWYENAPMTLLESFAYGKPVIASNIGGVPELVEENKTGLLFKPCDFMGLRENILFLINNPSQITLMGQKARLKVEEEYNVHVHLEKVIQIYERLVR